MLNRRHQILLIIATVLAVFYPSIFGEFNSIDDVEMVSSLLNMNDWSLKGLFIPHAGGGLYYRPLLYATFIIDRFVWFLSPSFMHLENILFHLANTLLVYFIAAEMLSERERKLSYLPLVSALCFGLHPITTEPVNWISGRTDVMAGTFVLLSAVALLKFKSQQKKYLLAISIGSLVLGMLTKEVALAFLPGALFILMARTDADDPVSSQRNPLLRQLKTALILSVLFSCAVLVFFYLRSAAFTSNSSRITMTLRFLFTDLDHTLFMFIKDFGFYMKKIYYPFPLNFAIIEVDPLYEILAVPILLLTMYISFQRSLVSAIFLAGAFLLTPAFLISFNQIAWTPYAERYVYIASAFITVASVFFVSSQIHLINSKSLVKVVSVSLIIVTAVATFQRNLVWRTNLNLFRDTVEKSPDFSKVWNEYGVALLQKGDLEAARVKFIRASSLYNFEYDEISDLNLAFISLKEGKEDEAVKIYRQIIEKSKGKSTRAYEKLISYLEKKQLNSKSRAESRQIALKLLEYNEKLYALNGKPFILYRLGQLSLGLNKKQKALEYFRSAYVALPEGDKYKGHAKKLVASLEEE